jgi:nicotinate-nucleotide pyrophosphorylase (carboxylating)
LGCCRASIEKPVRARIIAKSDGVWAADGLIEALREISADAGMIVQVGSKIANGEKFSQGSELMQWQGPARMVLAAERPFLNLASYSCGIASATRRLIDKVEATWTTLGPTTKGFERPRVTSTRKTLPQYRDIAVHSVISGGGHPHRVSLSGGVLIKENHIAAAGGIAQAIAGARGVAPHGLKIETEVRDLDELKAALKAGAEAVLLDNFEPKQVSEAVAIVAEIRSSTLIEVSGGITEENINQFVIPGVRVLSSGSLTHSVKATDLSLLVK